MATGPMDRNTSGNNLVNFLLQAIFTSSTSFTITPGTGGGSAKTITPPFKLRFLTAIGSDTANGTEATSGNNPGYTVGGISMGTTAFGAPTAGVMSNSNVISYVASGTQTANLTSAEVWDSAATPLRYLQGTLSAAVSGVVSGDTVQVAAAGISYDASGW